MMVSSNADKSFQHKVMPLSLFCLTKTNLHLFIFVAMVTLGLTGWFCLRLATSPQTYVVGQTIVGTNFNNVKVSTPADITQASESKLWILQSFVNETARLLRYYRDSSDRPAPTLTAENCTGLISAVNTSRVPNNTFTVTVTVDPAKDFERVLKSTANCTDYAIRSGFLYARVSEEELAFPLAFSLIVYKDLEQVERLLRAVYRPHNVYCLHADRKSHPTVQAGLRLIAGCLPNVFLLDRSLDVLWGTITVLEPELMCLERLWKHSAKWKYFINLTGHEFPLKTNKEMVRILRLLRGANDIWGSLENSYAHRWSKRGRPPFNLTITVGPVHVLASRGYVDYVIHSPVAHALYQWLRLTSVPDETFFSTLNNNPQLGVPGSFLGKLYAVPSEHPSVRSYKIWDVKGNPCAGQWLHSICQYGVGDLPRLTSSPFLVANKFTYGYQPLAYDCLEKWYFHKVAEENEHPEKSLSALNTTFYQNMDFIHKHYEGPILK